MIRRISKNNDLKDLIKSIPGDVVDSVYDIRYYIQGYESVELDENFTCEDGVITVILPKEDLQLLPNGILMRRALYKVADSSYPDGHYDLEFVDNMNIWLGGPYNDEGDSDIE